MEGNEYILSGDRNDFTESDGTTASETLRLIIPSILGVYVCTTLVTLLKVNRRWQYIVELIALLLPMVLTFTIMSPYINSLIIVSLILCISLFVLAGYYPAQVKPKCDENKEHRIPFITNARATINVLSVIAILAVDFQVFPRRFAKTSSYGFSLMDLGVGLYIFANSLVSPECLNKKDSIFKILKGCIPLLVLGILRLFFTKSMDYHVPVSEYGIHWNFFFTLLFTKCIGSLIIRTAHVNYMRTWSLVVLIIHELLLQFFLEDIVMNNKPRTNLFLANKEGISSILGYVSLYLFTVYFGYILKERVYGSTRLRSNIKMFMSYLIITGTLLFFCNGQFGTSRRLSNSSYCFWIVFVGVLACFIFYLGELLQMKAFNNKTNYIKNPYVYEALNFNALIFFLLGNVFTGLINFTCDTYKVDDTTALIILMLYVSLLSLIMCGLYEKRIKLKL